MQLVFPRKDAETGVSPTPYSDRATWTRPNPGGSRLAILWPATRRISTRSKPTSVSSVAGSTLSPPVMLRGNTHRWPAHRREAMSRREGYVWRGRLYTHESRGGVILRQWCALWTKPTAQCSLPVAATHEERLFLGANHGSGAPVGDLGTLWRKRWSQSLETAPCR